MQAQQLLTRKRTQALTTALRTAGEVELLLRVPSNARKQIAKELRPFGDIRHVYRSIPYLSILTEAKDARLLRESVEHATENAFRQGFPYAGRNIRSVELAATFRAPPSKKATNSIWNLERVGAYKAQAVSTGNGSSVGIIDTGVDYSHPELASCFGREKGHDFTTGKSDPMDRNGHGTHVAGIVAGARYGVAPGTTLYALRVLDEKGEGSEADVMAALEWAVEKNLDVVNLSLGAPFASQAFEELCYAAAVEGLYIVAAAGNSGVGADYPAAFGDPVVAVAATDEQDAHPGFSNIYHTNDIAAPGVNIISSVPGGYAAMTGTSMASPHVAGSLALVSAAGSGDLEQIMKDTAEPLGPADKFGAGMLRVDRMLESASGTMQVAQYGRKLAGMVKELVW